MIAKLPGAGRRRRPRRLKSLAFLPTLLTLGNLICGFAAIHFALREVYAFGTGEGVGQVVVLHAKTWELYASSYLSVAAGLILVGMVFDALDGFVARVTRSTSNFGGQLDSLADVVTCGVAPAILTVAFMTKELAGDSIVPSPLSPHFWGRFAWVSAAVYLCMAAIRLARYNVEHERADFDPRVFSGLPTPGAAAIVAAVILFQDQMGGWWTQTIVYAMPFVALTTAFLMVSRIPYQRFYHHLRGRRPFRQIVFGVVVLAVFLTHKTVTLLLLMTAYGFSGPVEQLIRRVRAARGAPPSDKSSDSTGDQTSSTRREHA